MELQNPDSELADPVFDERTVKQCEQRAAELREKIVVAGTRISSTELAEARLEIEEIEQYLRSSTGAWKRPRKFSTPEEKSRKSISITTRRTLHKIQLLHQPLADHLSKAIKFGRQIGYFPDREITWQL